MDHSVWRNKKWRISNFYFLKSRCECLKNGIRRNMVKNFCQPSLQKKVFKANNCRRML